MIIVNLVTPKAAAKQELLFNKPASDDKKKSLNFWKKNAKAVAKIKNDKIFTSKLNLKVHIYIRTLLNLKNTYVLKGLI